MPWVASKLFFDMGLMGLGGVDSRPRSKVGPRAKGSCCRLVKWPMANSKWPRESGAEVGCCDGAVQAVYESYDNSTNLR